MIDVIPDESMNMDKAYYHGVYIIIYFWNWDVANRKEEQAEMEPISGQGVDGGCETRQQKI